MKRQAFLNLIFFGLFLFNLTAYAQKDFVEQLLSDNNCLTAQLELKGMSPLARGHLVDDLLKALTSEKKETRFRAARALEILGPEVQNATKLLSKALLDEDKNVRVAAALALGSIREQPRKIVSELVPLLQDSSFKIRAAAAFALGKIGHGNNKAIFELIKVLSDNDPLVREFAAFAIAEIGPRAKKALKPLLKNLEDPVLPVCRATILALGELEVKSSISALNKYTSHEDESIAKIAKKTIETLEKGAYTDILLTQLLTDEEEPPKKLAELKSQTQRKKRRMALLLLQKLKENNNVRAAFLLGELGPVAVDAVPELVKKLKFSPRADPVLRRFVGQALGKIMLRSEIAIPALIKSMKNKNESNEVREEVVQAIGAFGWKAKNAIGPLGRTLKSNHQTIPYYSAKALGKVGPAAKRAVSPLTKILKEHLKDTAKGQEKMILACVVALGNTLSKKAVPVLNPLLKSPKKEIQFQTAVALSKILPKKELIPILLANIEGLKENLTKQAEAFFALKRCGILAENSVARLFEFATNKEVKLEYLAEALMGIALESKLTFKQLLETLKSSEKEMQIVAIMALAKMGKKAKDAIPLLIKLVQGKDAEISLLVIEAFKKINDRRAVSVLNKLLRARYSSLKRASAVALVGLGAGSEKAALILLADLENQDKRTRLETLTLLGDLGRRAKKAEKTLIKLLPKAETPELSWLIREVLERISGKEY